MPLMNLRHLYGRSSGLSWQFCLEPTFTGHVCMLLLYQYTMSLKEQENPLLPSLSLHATGNNHVS